MVISLRYFLLVCCWVLLIPNKSFCQTTVAEKRTSPLEMATYKFKGNYIKITYGSPYKRGRAVFGDLVPYGKVWRTGANEATELTTTRNIMFGGKFLKAGTYSLFTIPNEKTWIIILNKNVGQFGAFEYDRTKDVMRIEANSRQTEGSTENFILNFSPSDKEKEAILFLWWDRTKVEIPIGILN